MFAPKTKQLQDQTDSEKADQYLGYLQDTIITCLRATNQTYVEALKNKTPLTQKPTM